jgi:predicted transcriptional regulator
MAERGVAVQINSLLALYDNIRPCHNFIMSTSRSRTSRVFTVSFPEALAKQVDKIARDESRNISELFREAFRTYKLERIHKELDAARAYARASGVPEYTEEEIEGFVDEIRAERFAARRKRT